MLWDEASVTLEFEHFGVFSGGEDLDVTITRESSELPKARYRVRLVQEELVFGLVFVQDRKDTELDSVMLERGELIEFPEQIQCALKVPESTPGTYQGQCVTCRFVCVLEYSKKLDIWEPLASKEVPMLGTRTPQQREAVMSSIERGGLRIELWADQGSVRAGESLRLTMMIDQREDKKLEDVELPSSASIHIATIEEGKIEQGFFTRMIRKLIALPFFNPFPGLWYRWPRTILWNKVQTLEFDAEGAEHFPLSGSIEIGVPPVLEPSGNWHFFKVFTNARIKLLFRDGQEERVTVPVHVYRDWQWYFHGDTDPHENEQANVIA